MAAPGAPEPATQDEEVNQELLAVLAAMFRDRVPLLALVLAHEQRVMDLFRQDEERFRSARTTATLTMYIEERLSYRSITKINELFKPLADMLGSPRLFASIGEQAASTQSWDAPPPPVAAARCCCRRTPACRRPRRPLTAGSSNVALPPPSGDAIDDPEGPHQMLLMDRHDVF